MWDNIKQLYRHGIGTAGGKEREDEEEKGFEKKIMKNFSELMGDKSPTYPRNSQTIKLNKCHPPTHTHTHT